MDVDVHQRVYIGCSEFSSYPLESIYDKRGLVLNAAQWNEKHLYLIQNRILSADTCYKKRKYGYYLLWIYYRLFVKLVKYVKLDVNYKHAYMYRVEIPMGPKKISDILVHSQEYYDALITLLHHVGLGQRYVTCPHKLNMMFKITSRLTRSIIKFNDM